MKKKAHRIAALTPRDLEILPFIWKWKFVSTACLVHRFFHTKTGYESAYRRLKHLQIRGLVEIHLLNQEKFLWTISKNGFALIKSLFPENMDFSYKSESPYHDYWTTTIHLGPWFNLPKQIQFFSEQELRSLPVEAYPSWVPQTQVHRPDGYWFAILENKQKLIALEVELSQKNDDRYVSVARFYRDCSQISRVVWAVSSLAFALQLERKFRDAVPEVFGMHNFVLIEDIKAMGWNAPIKRGLEADFPLYRLLVSKSFQTCFNWDTLSNLDCRKKPYNLNVCGLSENLQISDRSAYSASLINSNSYSSDPSSNSNVYLSNNKQEKLNLILR